MLPSRKALGYDLITVKFQTKLRPNVYNFLTVIYHTIMRFDHFPPKYPKPDIPLDEIYLWFTTDNVKTLRKINCCVITIHGAKLHQFRFRQE